MGIIHQMHGLHVTGGSTLCWIICTIAYYEIGTIFFWLWLLRWNSILSYLSFKTRCCRYVLFLLSSFLLISDDLISVCVSLHECGSRWVSLENLQFSNCLLAISVRIFDWYSVLETCIWTWTFDCELWLETWIFNWEPTYL